MTRQAHFAHQAAQQQLQLQEVHVAKHQHTLHAPLPNLFRATFEQALHQSPGELWLQQRVAAFDSGGPQQRKQVLQDFLEYVGVSSASGMEELFSNQAHLFFIRLAAWFSATLPTLFELPLQLKVFLTFLEFREQTFVRAFFESGAVVPLLQSLSDDDFDIPDEVRCLVLLVLHKLAANGRHHKELLCSQGLVRHVLACISDALRWETLKCAGRLLCEVFLSNPRHQCEVLDALQDLLTRKVALTQRVGAQAIVSLLHGDAVSPLLCEPARHRALAQLALRMLESEDLRVSADAYCLLCRLVRLFNCDELLFDFARAQLRTAKDMEREWLRLELEGQELQRASAEEPPPVGGRHHGTFVNLHRRITEAIKAGGGPPSEDMSDGQEFVRRVNRCGAEFREAFRAEAGHILKWSLLLYLAKRNAGFCAELVQRGLTETLLVGLLDAKHPVRQAAALSELHRLRMFSPEAQQVAEAVLGSEELLRAVSLDQFTSAASPTGLAKARFRLRNLQLHGRSQSFSSMEHQLHLEIVEKQMVESLGISAEPPTSAFITETVEPEEAKAPSPPEEDEMPRTGSGRVDMEPVPSGSPDLRRRPSPVQEDALESGPLEELPAQGLLSSLLLDPLDISADEESALMQEVKHIESCVGLGLSRRAPVVAPPSRHARASSEPRPTHRPSLEHRRALALRPMPPPGMEPRRPAAASARAAAPSRASSALTELSLRCGGPEAELELRAAAHTHTAACSHGGHERRVTEEASRAKLHPSAPLFASFAETSVGPEQTIPDELSREMPSSSYHELPAEESRFTLGTDSLTGMPSLQLSAVDALEEEEDSIEELPHPEPPAPRVVERTAITSVVEFPRLEGRGARGALSARGVAPRAQRRVVQVAAPPYHDCVAFSRHDIERERIEHVREARGLIHPGTQQRFQDLRAAGPFPRKGVGAAHAPAAALRAASAGPGASGHEGPALVEMQPPASARLPRARGGAEAASALKATSAGTATLAAEGGRRGSPSGKRRRHGTLQRQLFEAYPTGSLQPIVPSKTKGSMKDYFPASARAIAA